MAYTKVSLPASAADGPGAAVDVSTFGSTKTITVKSPQAGVIVEGSNQASPVKWAPICSFSPSGVQTIEVACRWMRARVVGWDRGPAPVVEVGGEDDGATFATLNVPAGNGSSAGVDTSSLAEFKTVHVSGSFKGVVNVEVSQDGGASYQTQMSFQSGEAGMRSGVFAADYMRVSRAGSNGSASVPEVNVGSAVVGGGGGGGGGGVAVQEDGTPLGTFTTINFTGDGATATDGGGGVADVAVPAAGFVLDESDSGGVVQNNGTGNSAPGANSIAGGGGSVAAADHSTALGLSNTEDTADFATAIGASNVRSGAQYGTALGNSNVNADSLYGTALGNSNVETNSSYATAAGDSSAAGEYCTALGGSTADGEAATSLGYADATGEGAFASGISSADGAYSTALGSTSALAAYATSIGLDSAATREGQASVASGRFAWAGDAQTSVIVMRGSTPGAGAGESVELAFGELGASPLILVNNRAYTLKVTAVAHGIVGGNRSVQSFQCMYAVRKDAGLTVLAETGTPEQIGDAGSSSWTLTGSVGAGPDRFVLTFGTGETTSSARCVARVEVTETEVLDA